MARSYRARLTLVAAGSAGVLFLILFAVSAEGLRRAEAQAAQSELSPAVAQVVADLKSGTEQPDLREVVGANPEVSLAVFDLEGALIARDGKLTLPAPGVPSAGLIVRSETLGNRTVIAGLDWTPHEDMIRRFALLCLILWFPLVGTVALATWVTAGATFAPLERLAGEAEAMSLESLSARLRTDDSGEYRDFTQRLNRFLDRLETSVRREERFLSDAAHELRTPLTILRGQIETTLRNPRSTDEYRATLAVLAQETTRLASLVELLLRTATPRSEAPPGIDLAEAAERAHARWADRFADKGVRLELKAREAVANLTLSEFDVVVDNLLANSLRAAQSGTTCTIEATSTGDVSTLSVADEGPGIAPEDAERVFRRFERADSEGGFGIGLALCRRIVGSRGGRIWIEPNAPQGCVVSVELGGAPPGASEGPSARPPSGSA